uniref:Uncharacterized protein n=1 Tax=Nelumbo nucifera TaxID=4432 RepID=A0A822XJC0_NELNU|nr:TPA_asm: hypothetical protein HUJ06_020714 [Nelumbo nucifera]
MKGLTGGRSNLDTSASSSRNSFDPHPMVAEAWDALRRSLVYFRGHPVGTVSVWTIRRKPSAPSSRSLNVLLSFLSFIFAEDLIFSTNTFVDLVGMFAIMRKFQIFLLLFWILFIHACQLSLRCRV